jgi:hypothetical protein
MHRFKLTLAIAAIAALAPALAAAGDRETAQQIADAIRESGTLNDYAIGVKFKDGTAWLKGNVSDRQQMARAVQIAESAAEVTTVVNQLEIPTPAQLAWRDETPRQAGNSHFLSDKISNLLTGRNPQRSATTSSRRPRARSTTAPQQGNTGQQRARLVSNDEPIQPAAAGTSPGAKSARASAVSPRSFTPPAAARPASARGIPGAYHPASQAVTGAPIPTYVPGTGMGVAPVAYDHPHMPNYAWPSYAAHPNYAGLTYPRQYSPTAWPYIGPFYPYPQVPLGWRKVTLEWDDGWWFLDFDDKNLQHDGSWWW